MGQYGNTMAMENSISKAIHWYEMALNSNPDMSPIHPSNLRAWYNKGVALFRSGDTDGAGRAFGIILDEVEKNSTVPPGTAFVLNAIGSIAFANKDYAGAYERFLKSLSLAENELSPCHRAVTQCNIATAQYKMDNHERSQAYFEQALQLSKFANEESSDIRATLASIRCNFACLLWKRTLYLRAYNMFMEAASTGDSEKESEFSIKCSSYAEACRCKLIKQKNRKGLTLPASAVIAKAPRFKASLIPIGDGHNATRYTDAVFSPRRKLSAALGVELTDHDSFIISPSFSEDTKGICEYLQKQAKGYRAEHALEFEGLVVEKLNSKFESMKMSLGRGKKHAIA